MLDQIIQDIYADGWSYQQNVVDKSRLAALGALFQDGFLPAKVGRGQDLQRVREIRGDFIKWIDPRIPPEELRSEMILLENLRLQINQNFFLNLKEFECHLARYPNGTFYKKHLDRFEKDSSRSLTFIFYLHEEWSPKDGGELILYNKQNEILKTFFPEPGSMICFLSEDFPHEVRTCFKERRSLTGWMHTRIIT